MTAFPGFFLSSLGVPCLTRFYRGYAIGPTAISVIYRREGRVAGLAVGTTHPGFYGRLLGRDLTRFGRRRPGRDSPPACCQAAGPGVGYRGGEASGPGQGLFASLCLEPSERGGGLGRKLAVEFVEVMVARGVDSIALTTDNEGANRLYSSLGWAFTGVTVTPEGRRMNHYRLFSPVRGRAGKGKHRTMNSLHNCA